ncbi:hypothetical protein [Nocardioides lijunqiniae]|uniref:hypothetical protein n=1 Tax=Nocardioides lijunqiniae TaxID=2760832 RepID=UPI001878CA25|nr:hypothetical protein [Nocardioides lijunqiniae]
MPAPVRRRHRALVPALCAGLALAGLVGAAGPATAAPVAESLLQSVIDFGTDAGSDPTCSAATGDRTADATVGAGGGARTASTTSSTTITDANDASDITTLTGRSSVAARVTAAGGSLRDLEVRATLRGTLVRAQGAASSCRGSVGLTATAGTTFTVARPGWLSLTMSTSRGGATMLAVSGPDQELMDSSVDVRTTDRHRFLLPRAGTYVVALQARQTISSTPASDPSGATLTASLRGEFRPAGSAVAASAGPGARYLALAAERSCAADSLAATFTARARTVRSATIYVDGRRVAKVRAPKRGRTVRITRLRDPQPVSVRAVIVPRKGRTVAVTRSYVACS